MGGSGAPLGESIAKHGAVTVSGQRAHGAPLGWLLLHPVHCRGDLITIGPEGPTGCKVGSVGGQVCHGRWWFELIPLLPQTVPRSTP